MKSVATSLWRGTVLHTGLESSNIIELDIIGFASRPWAVTPSGQTKGATGGASDCQSRCVEGVVDASLLLYRTSLLLNRSLLTDPIL